MSLAIRPDRESDWARLRDIHDRARLNELRGSVDLAAFLPLAETAGPEGLFDGVLWVACDAGRVLGFVAVADDELTWLDVDPDAYRRGIGRRLLRHAVARCGPVVTTEALAGNAPAVALDESEGFAVVATVAGKLEGNETFPTTGVRMRLEQPRQEARRRPDRPTGSAVPAEDTAGPLAAAPAPLVAEAGPGRTPRGTAPTSWQERPMIPNPIDPDRDEPVTLREITAATVRDVCALRVAPSQEGFVAPNALSLAQALFSPVAWYRAIYAAETPVGFVMLEEEDPTAPFLWRLMIAADHQGRGYGRRAVALLLEHVRTRPAAKELVTNCVPGDGSPCAFYRALGFVETGEVDDGEVVMRLPLARATRGADGT